MISTKEFGKKPITASELATIGGSSTAIWLMTGFTFTFIPDQYATSDVHKIFAGLLSLVFSFTFVSQVKPFTFKSFIIAILNATLLFCSSTGLNAIDNGMKRQTGKNEATKGSTDQGSVIPFFKDISWWPDIQLLEQVQTQSKIIYGYKKKYGSLITATSPIEFFARGIASSYSATINFTQNQTPSVLTLKIDTLYLPGNFETLTANQKTSGVAYSWTLLERKTNKFSEGSVTLSSVGFVDYIKRDDLVVVYFIVSPDDYNKYELTVTLNPATQAIIKTEVGYQPPFDSLKR